MGADIWLGKHFIDVLLSLLLSHRLGECFHELIATYDVRLHIIMSDRHTLGGNRTMRWLQFFRLDPDAEISFIMAFPFIGMFICESVSRL